jgi:hypothetical protein
MKLYYVRLPFDFTSDINQACKYDHRYMAEEHCANLKLGIVTIKRDGELDRHCSNFRVEEFGDKFVIVCDAAYRDLRK